MKSFSIFTLLLAAAGLASGGELTTNELQRARSQGSNALGSLQRRIKPATAPGMGFASTNEAQLAVLGEPFRIYQIPEGQMKGYNGTRSFRSMLVPQERVIFPALVNGVAKSTIIVSLVGTNWRTEKFGDPALIKGLFTAREKVAATNSSLASRSFAVDMPSPGFWFLGYTNLATNTVTLLVTDDVHLGPVKRDMHGSVNAALMSQFAKASLKYSGKSN